jgi:hypothetical protein
MNRITHPKFEQIYRQTMDQIWYRSIWTKMKGVSCTSGCSQVCYWSPLDAVPTKRIPVQRLRMEPQMRMELRTPTATPTGIILPMQMIPEAKMQTEAQMSMTPAPQILTDPQMRMDL